jgi:hypothetical protein
MNLDQLLTDALRDDRLALPVPADTLAVVRRKRRHRQRLTVAATTVSAVALVGGAVGATSVLSSPAARVSSYASGGVPEGSPAPGITPAFVAVSGHDWLMTHDQWVAYSAGHTHPSPAPGQSTVHSPAPLAEQSAVLLDEVQQAGLPEGTRFHRDDSSGGQPGVAAIEITLPDGQHLVVTEQQMQEPFDYEGSAENTNEGATVFDVPGTASAGVAFPSQPSVLVVSRGGITTSWYAGSPGPTRAQLQTWATAAEQHSRH